MQSVTRLLLLIGVASLTACAQAAPKNAALPHDVVAFTERRDLCDHMRGEIPDPPSPERMRELEAAIARYCTGTDARLSALKGKYAGDASVMVVLAAYEDSIEASPAGK